MADVSKFSMFGSDIYVKDVTARENIQTVNNTVVSGQQLYSEIDKKMIDGCKVIIMGDSIGAGFGWWHDNIPKSDTTDGFGAIIRERFPNCAVTNVAVNETTLASGMSSYPTMASQLKSAVGYDVVIICCGINDFTLVYNKVVPINRLGTLPTLLEQPGADMSTSYNAFAYYITAVRSQNPNAEILYFIPGTSAISDYMLTYAHYDNLKRICQFMGVRVFNADNHIPRYECFPSLYFDRTHYNEAGYRHMGDQFIDFILGYTNENEIFTDMLFTMNIGSVNDMLKGVGEMYRQWWMDGTYRVVIPTSDHFERVVISAISNAHSWTGIAVSGTTPLRFYIGDDFAATDQLQVYVNADGMSKLSDLTTAAGSYLIPNNKAPTFTGLPAALKSSDIGHVIVCVMNPGDYASGFMYSMYTQQQSGGLFRFTKLGPGDTCDYYKLQELKV